MKMNDIARISDVTAAMVLLTRLPMPRLADSAFRGAAGVWAYPLAGLAVSVIVAAVAWLSGGLGASVAAALALIAGILATGAMHEDGLADACDGLWGGTTPARRLEIMRDSRIGTYGVLGLVASVLLRWALVAALLAQGLLWGPIVAAAVLSRAAMVVLMAAMGHARSDGLSHAQGRPDPLGAGLAVAVALVIGVICLGWIALIVTAAVALSTLTVALLAQRKIGGQTGDILGACQQIAEAVALMTILALIGI